MEENENLQTTGSPRATADQQAPIVTDPQPTVESPLTDEPKEKKFAFLEHKAFIAFLIILALITTGALVYLYIQNQSLKKEISQPAPLTPTPSSSETSVKEETPDLTANWETYSNEGLGFSLKYPQDWEIHDRLDEESRALQILKTGPTNGVLDWTDGSILIISPTDSENIDLSKILAVPKEVVSQLNTSVFNSRGWHGYRWEGNTDDPINYNETIIATKSSPEGNIFKISWSQININNGLSAEKYLYQILSTFEFIEPVDISDWETHLNDEFGFIFKYPQGYNIKYEENLDYHNPNHVQTSSDFELLKGYLPQIPIEKMYVYPINKSTSATGPEDKLDFFVYRNPDRLNAEQWYLKYNYYPFNYGENSYESEIPKYPITINGIDALYGIPETYGWTTNVILVPKDKLMFLIRTDKELNTDSNIDKILSTFQFTE